MTPKTTLAFIVLLVLNASPCPAQGQDPPGTQDPAPATASVDQQRPKFRRWSVTVGLGNASRGPAGDLEAAMRAGGFGDRSTGFGVTTDHPYSETGAYHLLEFAKSLDIEFRFREHLGVGAVYSRAPIGTTIGYHQPMQDLRVNTYVNTVGLTGTFAYRGLRAAIGPAWHVARAAQHEGNQVTRRRLGFVGRFGVQTPARSRVYFDARAQYNHVGRATVGPFVSPAFFSLPERAVQASAVRFNYWLFTIGVGVRF